MSWQFKRLEGDGRRATGEEHWKHRKGKILGRSTTSEEFLVAENV